MHILISPNAFKGSISAIEAAECIASGLRESRLSCTFTNLPIGDGGDGTAELIAQKRNALIHKIEVHDPLGRKILAKLGWLKEEKTAIIEMSEASGLRLLEKEELFPLKANSRGTGELIRAALNLGATKIILGVGGSATVDGATGMLAELGVRFLDAQNMDICNLPEDLINLKQLDISGLDPRLKEQEMIVLCDVNNMLLGDKGAACVFGPQKGADETQVRLLEEGLQQFNTITSHVLKRDMSSIPHGGAAGGMAAGLSAFLRAKLVPGIDYFLEVVEFNKIIEGVDLVITAEGGLDDQTLEGKGPAGLAKLSKEKNIPVVMLAGSIPLHPDKEMHEYFDVIFPIGHTAMSLEKAMKNTAANLTRTAFELGNLLSLRKK